VAGGSTGYAVVCHGTNELESVSDSVGILILFNDKEIDDIGDKEGDILPRKMHGRDLWW